MSILSSGYMDGDGPIWLQPPSPELLPAAPVQTYYPRYLQSRNQHRVLREKIDSHEMDPWKFPLLDSTAARRSSHDKGEQAAPKSCFTVQQYAALGNFLNKAPRVLENIEWRRQQQQQYEAANPPSGARNINLWSFERLPTRRTRANSGRAKFASPLEEEAQSGAESTHDFQSRKSQRQPGKTTATKERTMTSKPKEPSHTSASPGAFDGLFQDAEDDAHQGVSEEVEAPTPPPAGNKNKKQLRKAAKAKKAAEKAEQEQIRKQSRDESPSPSVKVAGWDMDPHSKPASNASRSRRSVSSAGGGAGGDGDAWGGADMGDMFEEQKEPVPLHRSHRSHGSRTSRHEDDGAFPVPGDWPEKPQQQSQSGRSKRSSSRREGSKLNSGLETIHEDATPALGWGEEQVWRPPGQVHQKESSRKASSRRELSHHSHRSHRSTAPEPPLNQVEQRRHGSRRSSHRSTPPVLPVKQISVISGPHTSYRAPTVQDAPDGWSPSWEKKPEQARSHRSSSVRTKTSVRHARAAAEALPERAPSYQSHHTGLDGHRSPTRQSYRSKSTEKVNEWFENVPPPPSKALSMDASLVESHRSLRRGRRSSHSQVAWENGEVPPNASVGTGYDIRQIEHRSQDGQSDKRTSSDSSTKADIGVRPPSVRSARSSRRSWNAEPVNEAYGDW